MKTTFSRAIACALPLLLAACGGSQDLTAPSTTTVSSAKRGNTDASLAAYHEVVQRVYVAYYGRPADPAGLDYWAAQYQAFGMPLTVAEISASYGSNPNVRLFVDAFGNSDEASALYSGDNDAFISAIYRNLFNTPGDAAGRAFWVEALNRGDMTRGIAALYIMSGAQSTDVTSIDKKLEIARSFTTSLNTEARREAYKGLTASAVVRGMLSTVGAATDTASFTGVASTIGTLETASPAGQYLSFIYDQATNGYGRIGLVAAAGGQGSATQPNALSFLVGGFTSATVQNGLASNFAMHSLLHWKNERLYRQNLISSGGLPAAEIRSTLTFGEVCAEDSEAVEGFDVVDPSLSYQVFRQKGADGVCKSADDSFAAVRMNMSASTAPLAVRQPLFGIHAANGSLSGFLVKDALQVQRVDSNFANPVTMFTLAADIVGSANRIDQLGNLYFFESGGKMYLWDAGSAAPGAPTLVATLAAGESFGEVKSIDNSEVFVSVKDATSLKVLRYTVASKTTATVGTLPLTAFQSASMHLSASKVILYNIGSGALSTMARSGGSPHTILAGGAGFLNAAIVQVSGERVWVNSLFGKVTSLNTDGSGTLTLPGAQYAGCVYKPVIRYAADANACDAILLVDGGVFKDYDAASGAARTTYGALAAASGQSFYAMSSYAANGQGAVLTRISVGSDGETYVISNFHFKAGSAGLAEVRVQ